MHELSIAEALVRQGVEAGRRSAPGRKVTELCVEVGELSGVVPGLLREAFPFAAAGTGLAGTRLKVKKVAARFECRACKKRFKLGEGIGCPACGASDLDMIAGREIRLTAIEVEDRESGGR